MGFSSSPDTYSFRVIWVFDMANVSTNKFGGVNMQLKEKKREPTTTITMQNRLRSKALWLAIFSFTIFVLKTYFDIEIPKADELMNGILLIATLLGIFNNPTSRYKF